MKYHLLMAFLVFCLSACSTSPKLVTNLDEILVAEAPIYRDGEEQAAKFYTNTGMELDVHQRAHKDAAGSIWIHSKLLIDSNTVSETIRNVQSGDFRQITQTEQGEKLVWVTETTCVPSLFYPVILGKAYKCSETIAEAEGASHVVHIAMVYDIARWGPDGALQFFCGVRTMQKETLLTRTRMCYSADGKWVLLGHLFEVTSQERPL
jgi:hypothetical protein